MQGPHFENFALGITRIYSLIQEKRWYALCSATESRYHHDPSFDPAREILRVRNTSRIRKFRARFHERVPKSLSRS